MKAADFIRRVKKTRQEYDQFIGRLNEEQLLAPCTCGDWSVKDVVAHVTWYEHEMIGMIQQRALRGSDLWNQPIETRNDAIHAANRKRSLEDVLMDSMVTHQSLFSELAILNDDDLLQASRFQEMPAEWFPWEVIASNTFEHYHDHLSDLRRAFPEKGA